MASASLALGLQHHRAGRLGEAEKIYRRVLAVEPENPDALHLFGVLAHQLGRHATAIETISRALRFAPNRADYLSNLGDVYRTVQLYPEALEVLRRAVTLAPANAAAHNNLGLVLQALGHGDEAEAAYRRALELEPDFPEAHNNLGNIWKDRRLPERAEASYLRALALRPDWPEAQHNLGNLYKEIGRREEAAAAFAAALALRPDYPMARFGFVMAQLAVIYRSEDEIDERRAAYHEALLGLGDYVRGGAADSVRLSEAVGSHQPFFLAYQGRNDRDLMALYGGIASEAMARRFPTPAELPKAGPGETIRVGVVSGYFCNHSIWKIPLRGWLSQLDRRRFRVHCYHTQAQRDAETVEAEGLADRFVQGPLPLERWRTLILADGPHVLLYPELGMDPVSAQLACQRLARVQATTLGHPTPGGFPTIDTFLGSDLMEPEGAETHYSETLVRLPGLSVHYEPLPPPEAPVSRAELGLPEGAAVFWCCQSLYKYLPRYDGVFARIAAAVGPDCRFVFIGYQAGNGVSEVFRRRLDDAFAAAGLRAADYCLLLPRLSPRRFLAVGAACDVFLDSIGWSGFNSTLEASVNDLPVVTLPGDLMRGRHSAAVLRAMGVTDTIAASLDDYVALAARLATDWTWRAEMRRAIAAGKHRAYRDRACIAALEDWLERAARG